MVLIGMGILFFNTYHLFTDSGIFLKDYNKDAPVGRYNLKMDAIAEYRSNFYTVFYGKNQVVLHIENQEILNKIKDKTIEEIPVVMIPRYSYANKTVEKRFNLGMLSLSRIVSYDTYKQFDSSHFQNTVMGITMIILPYIFKFIEKRGKNNALSI